MTVREPVWWQRRWVCLVGGGSGGGDGRRVNGDAARGERREKERLSHRDIVFDGEI